MITIYGLTNEKSKDINRCIMYVEDPWNPNTLITFSYQFYEKGFYSNPPPSLHDFKYMLKISIKPDNVFVVKSKADIFPKMYSQTGLNLNSISKHLKRKIKSLILYHINGGDNVSYAPVMYVSKDCIADVSFEYKQTPLQRYWISTEDCGKLDKLQCLNSQSCIVTKNKGIFKKRSCSADNKLQRLKFSQLNRVMLPYKFYSFTEYQTDVHSVEVKRKYHFKPEGFWFAQGDEWLQHLKKTNFRMNMYSYLYELEIDMNEVLHISTLKQLHEFTKKFCSKSDCFGLDWTSIVKTIKKSGLVISPNLKTIIWKYKEDVEDYFKGNDWYLTWDIASGVIWDAKAIKSIQLIYAKEPGKFVKYGKE